MTQFIRFGYGSKHSSLSVALGLGARPAAKQSSSDEERRDGLIVPVPENAEALALVIAF